MKNILLIASLCALVSGCASKANLTIHSQPEGAYIVQKDSGKAVGTSPVTITYDAKRLKQFKRKDGCYLVKGFDAQWVSGATASIDPITLCGSNKGHYNITFSRPANYPNIDKDLSFSLQVKKTIAAQQQANAARDAANEAAYNNILLQQRSQMRCYSYQVGNSIQTNCN